MANTVLIPALAWFRESYPHIQLAVGITDKPVSLIGEAVDCAVRMGPLADTSLIARTLYHDRLVTCASPAYLARANAPTEPTQLRKGHDLVGYFSKQTGEMWPMVFRKDGRKVEVASANVLANDSTGHVNMLLSGLGIGQTYLSTVKAHLAAGALVRVLDDWTNGCEPVSILFPPSKKLNARARVFIDWLAEHLIAAGATDEVKSQPANDRARTAAVP